MNDLSIVEFDELHAAIELADKRSGYEALHGTAEGVAREKAKIAAAMERLKYYDAAALLATMKLDAWQWKPIASLPDDDRMVMAWVPDGRMMIWKTSLLRSGLAERTPEHLKFPATHWRDMPGPPSPQKPR